MGGFRRVGISLLLILAVNVHAQTYTSDVTPPIIIELFTSEGCSSCPPAERWLNRFVENSSLWSHYFPLAWHVDYWDSLGWPDRFANRDYSRRQKLYKRQTPLASVYTPGVLVNGRAWRGWVFNRQLPGEGRRDIGRLRVMLQQGHFQAVFFPVDDRAASYELHGAIVGFGLTTRVKRGENAGKNLEHEFVVLAHSVFGESEARWSGDLPRVSRPLPPSTRHAALFWIQHPDSPVPLQMTGGWMAF